MKKSTLIKLMIALLALSLLLILPACNSAREITGEEADRVLAYAEPLADQVIEGLNTRDYATFSADFSDEMKRGLPQAGFESLADTFESKLGEYQSREVERIEEIEGNIAVVYTMAYSQADAVTLRLVTTPEEPHLVNGLWFNAPELR